MVLLQPRQIKDGIHPVLSLLERFALDNQRYILGGDAELALTVGNFGYLDLVLVLSWSLPKVQRMMHPFPLLSILEVGSPAVLILLLQIEHVGFVESLKHALPIDHALLGYQLRIQSQRVHIMGCTLR